jgi:type IV secretory pathway TraG/TraD family ATPase VirD4
LSLCLKNKDIERRAREAVLSSLCAFRYPEVARNTSTSTFSLRELNEEGSKITVYLNYSPRNAAEAFPLIRIFTGLVIASRQSTDIYGRLLLALDDFSVSGCARLMNFTMPDLVSRNIKPAITFQHLEDTSLGAIWKKCPIRSVLQVINYETAELVSRELSGASPVSGQAFTSQDIMRLDEEEAIIVGCSEQPFQASTYPYYKDVAMLAKQGGSL